MDHNAGNTVDPGSYRTSVNTVRGHRFHFPQQTLTTEVRFASEGRGVEIHHTQNYSWQSIQEMHGPDIQHGEQSVGNSTKLSAKR
jgi:hypothetical protein